MSTCAHQKPTCVKVTKEYVINEKGSYCNVNSFPCMIILPITNLTKFVLSFIFFTKMSFFKFIFHKLYLKKNRKSKTNLKKKTNIYINVFFSFKKKISEYVYEIGVVVTATSSSHTGTLGESLAYHSQAASFFFFLFFF